MALAVGNANSEVAFVFPIPEGMAHPSNRDGQCTKHTESCWTGWPMALAVGDANSGVAFVFPTPEGMGHPSNCDGQCTKHVES